MYQNNSPLSCHWYGFLWVCTQIYSQCSQHTFQIKSAWSHCSAISLRKMKYIFFIFLPALIQSTDKEAVCKSHKLQQTLKSGGNMRILSKSCMKERARDRVREIYTSSPTLKKSMITALDAYWCCQYNSISFSCFPPGSERERWIFLRD